MKIKKLLATGVMIVTGVNGANAANIFAGSEYVLSTSTGSWDAANTEAIGMGGHLVAINSAAEQAALIGFFGSSERLWIGFNDIDSEGAFVWTNGDPVTYTNWNGGEPNNLGGEDVVVMNWAGSTGAWNDWARTNNARGIIELAVSPPESSPIPEPSGAPVLFLLSAALMGYRQRR